MLKMFFCEPYLCIAKPEVSRCLRDIQVSIAAPKSCNVDNNIKKSVETQVYRPTGTIHLKGPHTEGKSFIRDAERHKRSSF